MSRWSNHIFYIFLLYRLSSILFIQTSYAPDEYWQSLEVAHNMAFKYGYLTWEWKQGLRSFIYPFFFSLSYQFIKFLHLDFPIFIIYLPKVLQALLTAISDCCFLLLCRQFNLNDNVTKVSMFTNWFWYYCGFRTLTNTFETALTSIALYYYPWVLFTNKKRHYNHAVFTEMKSKTFKYLSLCALNCLVRPTAVTIWGPLVLLQLFAVTSRNIVWFFCCLIKVFVLLVPASLAIDYYYYGKFVISAYNFLHFNIFREISSFYGTHASYWYIIHGLPVVLGVHYFTFFTSLIVFFKKEFKRVDYPNKQAFRIWITIIFVNVYILSVVPHKEFRFALPLMPLMMLVVIKFITDFFKTSSKKVATNWIRVSILGFLIPCVLVGVFHQRGPIQLMHDLRQEVPFCQPKCFFLFLMPCHSTPLYSYLHVNVSTKFLHCDPPITQNSYDESEHFFKNPLEWLNTNWNDKNSPSHIALFDDLENNLSSFLTHKKYYKKSEILHTIFKKKHLGKYIVLYEANSLRKT